MKPFPVPAFTLIGDDCSISGSAIGNPSELRTLRKFAGRSKVAPTTELFPMSQINEALKHVREGSPLPRGAESRLMMVLLHRAARSPGVFPLLHQTIVSRHTSVIIASHN